LDDFIGDQNFAANEMRNLNLSSWTPHYGDLKNLIKTLLLGMGSIQNLPKINSLCICGPEKCGKKLLVEALCNEMDAVVFDLSSKIVKQLDDLNTTLSLVIQVAKKLQPSVIFVDGAHKPFIKNITPDEIADEPRKLGRFLFAKITKKISATDAVLLIGTTNQPWNSNYASLRACFQKFITFPAQVDYGTTLMIWNEGLRKKKIYDFDTSALAALAMVTRNYSTGDILDLIDKHLDLKRVAK
jgi:IQ and AAA domain-containing protein